MTKIAYFECPTGIAGDMCLGALVHAGVPLAYLIEELGRLAIADEYQLWAESVRRNGQQATKVHVGLSTRNPKEERAGDHQHSHEHGHSHKHEHSHDRASTHSPNSADSTETLTKPAHSHGTRHLPDIERLIASAELPARVTAWSLAVFRQLAEAEGAVHGISPAQVHFHEVGATDAIVDIVGTCLGLDWLNVDQLYCSALPIGGGTVWAAHGRLPVPAPAVLKLWEMRQVPIYSNGIDRELVTPTGAAIATTLAAHFGAPPPMRLHHVGLGAGSHDLAIPNILRLWIGETTGDFRPVARELKPVDIGAAPKPSQIQAALPQLDVDSVTVLQTQIDDLNPQAIGYVIERLFEVGALDVFTQAIGMKKARPGILLTVICRSEQVKACETAIFQETTTLGIRHTAQQRTILDRELQMVQTQYGSVRIKVARWGKGGKITNVQPEYEDCVQLARRTELPWREIHRSALQAWTDQG